MNVTNTMKKKKIICYVAGKSGGHIIPCLTLAQDERKRHPDLNILLLTTDEPLDIQISKESSAISWSIALPLKTASVTGLFDLFRLITQGCITICKTIITLLRYRPIKVVSTGGFLAIPVVICARMLGIPVQLYELNVQPGKATRFLTHWSIDLRICFAQTARYLPKKRCRIVAYPIRFFDNTKQITQKEALTQLHPNDQRKTIFIIGGSQGSLQINSYIKEWVTINPHIHHQIQVIHQIGSQETFNWELFYKEHNIPAVVYQFTFDIALHYSAADLIICRSGAGALFETLFFGKRCITIPLETQENNHQVANALAMQQQYDDLFTVLRQKDLEFDKQLLACKIEFLLQICNSQNHQTETSVNTSL
jgi:UDP-N-acetylglucosamine--N-acetylmuramyl-(pentapeptide) pyrophosphoryl-undecaprenol N-acetylglucosamine transferase